MSQKRAKALRKEVRKQMKRAGMTQEGLQYLSFQTLIRSVRPKPRLLPKWLWKRIILLVLPGLKDVIR